MIAYDLYLALLHEINLQINSELGCTSENWWLLNACPLCMYELEGEPELHFSFVCEFDGNNSLKCTNGFVQNVAEWPDSQKWWTDYWVLPDEVDVFKDEVPARLRPVSIPTLIYLSCGSLPLPTDQRKRKREGVQWGYWTQWWLDRCQPWWSYHWMYQMLVQCFTRCPKAYVADVWWVWIICVCLPAWYHAVDVWYDLQWWTVSINLNVDICFTLVPDLNTWLPLSTNFSMYFMAAEYLAAMTLLVHSGKL